MDVFIQYRLRAASVHFRSKIQIFTGDKRVGVVTLRISTRRLRNYVSVALWYMYVQIT